MLSLPSNSRVFVAVEATDLRKSYDGLAALVEGSFGHDLRAGDLFVFVNRKANQVRCLFWDRDGYCIWMKRLEAGTFRRVSSPDGRQVLEIDAAQLTMLLAGIDAPVVKRRKRYQHPTQEGSPERSSSLPT